MFHRRISGLEHDRQRLVVRPADHACRAEIEQLDLAVLTNKNIIRRNVTMNHTDLVHGVERLQHRRHDADRLRKGQLSALGQYLLDRFAAQQFHDNISGLVFLDEIINLDDAFQRAETGKRLRLFARFLQPEIELLLRLRIEA